MQINKLKATGIVRRLDSLGRIVIPREICKVFCINAHDPLEIFMDGENVILTKWKTRCIFCGSVKEVEQHKGKTVCRECMENLRNL